MSRDASADDKQPALAAHSTQPRDSRATLSSSSSDSGAMAGQSHPWQELRGEEADHSERKTTRSTSGSDNGVGNSVAAAKRSAGDEMPIEMDAVTGHATGPAPGEVDPGLGAAGTGCVGAAESAAPVGVQYKVYKRRWFGLVQLTLLNVIVSWDVSVLVSLLLTLAVVLVEDARGIQPFINTELWKNVLSQRTQAFMLFSQPLSPWWYVQLAVSTVLAACLSSLRERHHAASGRCRHAAHHGSTKLALTAYKMMH
jgi:hypothetical protein